MELNVGDYARFDYHRISVPIQISKIKEKEFDKDEKYYSYLTDNGLVITGDNIIKSSPKIIDLIEVGDYVNGFLVVHKENDYIRICPAIIPLDLKNDDIKLIVTHEQFESMEYKVGD